uniref:Uncharacterized protein n=1 Tax=Trypanosoma vivax (strain Y486) TaxID=1055687 RepID=G0UC71_TRYVY|nr:conserved hypothetical protein [Trypanosoma vivax Y486]
MNTTANASVHFARCPMLNASYPHSVMGNSTSLNSSVMEYCKSIAGHNDTVGLKSITSGVSLLSTSKRSNSSEHAFLWIVFFIVVTLLAAILAVRFITLWGMRDQSREDNSCGVTIGETSSLRASGSASTEFAPIGNASRQRFRDARQRAARRSYGTDGGQELGEVV